MSAGRRIVQHIQDQDADHLVKTVSIRLRLILEHKKDYSKHNHKILEYFIATCGL